MTAVLDVLEDIRRSGGHVDLVAPDRIRVSAPAALLPDLVARVRDVKLDLIAVLAKRGSTACCDAPWNDDDWEAYFEERAAIREYDGGLPRAQAERRARKDVRNAMQNGYGGTWPCFLTEIGIASPIASRD